LTAKRYDIDYSAEIGTDVPKRLRLLAGEKPKVLFLPSVRTGREIVELVRRTGIDYRTVTYDRAWDLNKWGFGDFYDVRASIGDFRIMLENLERVVTSDEKFDAMVLPGVNGWSHFSERTRQAIERRVAAGEGVVLIKPFHGAGMEPSGELQRLSPLVNRFEEGFGTDANAGGGYPDIAFDALRSEAWVPGSHYIARGIPFDLFPYRDIAYYPYDSVGETIIASVSGDPIAAVQQYGSGRVAAFGFYPRDILPQHSAFTGAESTFDGIVEKWGGARHSLSFPYLDYFYELIYRSILWAARREQPNSLTAVTVREGGIAVTPQWDGGCTIAYAIKDNDDGAVAEGTAAGFDVALPERLKAGGEYRVEIDLMKEGALLDWATVAVRYPLVSRLTCASCEPSAAVAGETVTATFRLEGGPASVELSVVDDFDRLLAMRQANVSKEGELSFVFDTTDVRSLHIRFRAELFIDGFRVQRLETPRVAVAPARRAIDDFEVFMCPQNRGQGEWLPLVGRLFRSMGVTGLFPGSPQTLTLSGAEGLGIYWYHRGGYVERKEMYLRTKDKTYLHRNPCLNDPAFWEHTERNMRAVIRENKRFGPVSYFANDEGSLTCYVDELDLCFCPHCMKEMRRWLGREYGGLERLNDAWGTQFPSWDDVVPFTMEEAQASGHFAPWADHRRFMEMTFADAYRNIGAIIRSEDAGGVIRMSGCQASTAFSGYDYYELHRHVGYFEAYSSGNQYELHRSFARPDTIIGAWFGYGADGAYVRNRIWNAVFHGITLISIFWEYSCLNPDFTYSRSARDMSVAFLELKRKGIGKLLLHAAKRDSLGIAVHYSMASIHGSFIMDDKTRFEANRQGWIHLLEDLGYQYDFVASQQIEAGELQAYRLLILPYSIALSETEAEQIRQFAASGGIVVGDLQTGLMDEHCRLFPSGKLDDLFGIERLTRRAKPFYINNGLRANPGFTHFDFAVCHHPGREEAESGLVIAEIGTREHGGIAAGHDDFLGKAATIVVHPFGRGKGIYLNMAADQYPQLRKDGSGGFGLRAIVGNVLKLAGIVKPATLLDSGDNPFEMGFESFYYRDGEAVYIGIQHQLGAKALGHDGLAVGGGGDGDSRNIRLRAAFARQGHVYDIRAGEYLGLTDTAAARMEAGDTKLYAVLPHRMEGISLDIPAAAKRGGSLAAVVRIVSDKPAGAYANVLAINVIDPEGEYAWLYSGNVAVTGREHRIDMRFPWNEKQGEWRITVKDAATGKEAHAAFEIR